MSAFVIDPVSLLVEVPASATLDALEAELGAHGFTLGVALALANPPGTNVGASASLTVGDWLAQGARGAASMFSDPADHLVAGLEATLLGGKKLEVRPGPRRAVGPDLTALLVGAQQRFGTIDRAWLRIHRRNVRRPALPLPDMHLDPPVTPAEARLLDALAAELER